MTCAWFKICDLNNYVKVRPNPDFILRILHFCHDTRIKIMARSLNSDAYGTIFQTNGMTTPGIFSFYILQISIDNISVHTLFHISNFFPLFQMFHVYFVCSPSTSIVSYSAIYTLHSFSCFAIPYLIWRNELVFFF